MAEPLKWKKGEYPTADKMNKLSQQAASLGSAPGSFVGAGLSLQRREVAGSAGDHYQIARGTALTAVVPAMAYFYVTPNAALEENSTLPAAPLAVSNVPGFIEADLAGTVYIIYNKACMVVPANPLAVPPTEAFEIDWEAIPTAAGTSAPPLRWFEYTVNKAVGTATATVKWLDNNFNQIGSNVTIYDPDKIFHGKVAAYLFAEDETMDRGFRGQALLRTDLAEEVPDDPRWEIINSESFSTTIRARLILHSNYPSAGSTLKAYLETGDYNSKTYSWDCRLPAIPDGDHEVGYHEDLAVFDPGLTVAHAGGAFTVGPVVLMELVDPNTTPAKYRVTEVLGVPVGVGKRIRGQVVGNILVSAGTFQMDNLTEVFGGAPPASPVTVDQTYHQGYADDQFTEAIFNQTSGHWENLPNPEKLGCHLAYTTYGFIYVPVVSLAGPGLSVSVGTGPGGCDQLKVVPPTAPETPGAVMIKSYTGHTVGLSSDGVLTVTVNYQNYLVVGFATGGGDSTVVNRDIWDKEETNVVTSVACEDDTIAVEDVLIEILKPPGA